MHKRCKIINDEFVKYRIRFIMSQFEQETTAREEKFKSIVEKAPVVFVCCGDLSSWKKTKQHTQQLLNVNKARVNKETKNALMDRVDTAVAAEMQERIPTTLLNVAIATEHIVLEAVELGLGSCWVRLFDENQVKQVLNLPENFCVVALLPVGVPDEEPNARPRLPLPSIVLPVEPKNC